MGSTVQPRYLENLLDSVADIGGPIGGDGGDPVLRDLPLGKGLLDGIRYVYARLILVNEYGFEEEGFEDPIERDPMAGDGDEYLVGEGGPRICR